MVLAIGYSIGARRLTFKAGTDNLRESHFGRMAERLIGKGMDLAIYDRRCMDEAIPHISALMKERCEEVIRGSEILVVDLRQPAVLEQVCAHSRDEQVIVDAVNIPGRERPRGRCRGLCW